MNRPDSSLMPINPHEPRHITDWQLWNMVDAYKDRGEMQYAIKPLFALPSLNIVYGYSGCLKSLLVTDAAMCVAADMRWLPSIDGGTGFPVKPGPVVWVDQDNGAWRTHEHVGALGRSRRVSEDAPVHYVSLPVPLLQASDDRLVDELIELVRPIGPLMIAFDNLGTISGGLDENSSSMIRVMSNLRRLAEATSSAVLVIHHERKGDKTKWSSRAGNALRGHSSIEASLDLALRVERKGKRPVVKVSSTKERGPLIDDFGAVFQYEHKPGTEDLFTARFYGCEPEADAKEQEILLAIDEVLRTGKIMGIVAFTGAVHERLDRIGEPKIRTVLDRERAAGRIVIDEKEGSPHLQRILPGEGRAWSVSDSTNDLAP